MKRESYRANNPVAVWDRISETQFEDTVHSGTARPVQRGRCYKGNGTSSYVELNVPMTLTAPYNLSWQMIFLRQSDFDAILGGNVNFSGVRLVSGSNRLNYRTDNASYNGILSNTNLVEGEYYSCELDVKSDGSFDFYLNGVVDNSAPSGAISSIVTLSTLFGVRQTTSAAVQRFSNCSLWEVKVDNGLLLKCDEGSGAISYDSSGNENHGTINNAVTVPVEEDPDSIHQYQDIFSWQNEVGYSFQSFVGNPATLFDEAYNIITTTTYTQEAGRNTGQSCFF